MIYNKIKNNIEMKDSRIGWIGNIPKNWEYKKIKYVSKTDTGGFFGNEKKGEIKSKLATTAQLSMDGIWYLDKMEDRFYSKFEYEKFKTNIGDIIVVKSSGSSSNIITGKAGYISKKEAGIVFGNFVMRIIGTNINKRFLYYFLISNITRKRIELMVSSTTYPNLKVSEYLSSKILIPPKETQEKIVEFLDEKTNIVSEAVEKKKKMIELLKEKRSSIITNAVTKGLDKNVEMKDSGVDWIGEIPSDWNVKKQKYLFSTISRKQKSEKQISLENIESWTGKYIQTDSVYSGDGVFFEKNDILFGKLRPYLAKVLLTVDNGEALGDLLVYRARDEILPSYGHKMILSKNIIDYINGSTYGTKMPRANPDFIKSLHMIYPSLKIQEKIIEFLDKKTSEIDSVIKKIEKQIKLLDEYKASLIYHSVTGKITI